MPRSRWTERPRQLALAALYFAVVTPVGLVVRTVRDPLRRSWDARRPTYLEPGEPSEPSERTDGRTR
ncbi:hypothetical protein ACIQ6Y_20480 [Streptomyces sp. NPDC096205]|uniref:hypothetical protein n=1 Tax=Streptomyces sp. NPDC096205 TaxID=3366081 RepID=UPI00382F2991